MGQTGLPVCGLSDASLSAGAANSHGASDASHASLSRVMAATTALASAGVIRVWARAGLASVHADWDAAGRCQWSFVLRYINDQCH